MRNSSLQKCPWLLLFAAALAPSLFSESTLLAPTSARLEGLADVNLLLPGAQAVPNPGTPEACRGRRTATRRTLPAGTSPTR